AIVKELQGKALTGADAALLQYALDKIDFKGYQNAVADTVITQIQANGSLMDLSEAAKAAKDPLAQFGRAVRAIGPGVTLGPNEIGVTNAGFASTGAIPKYSPEQIQTMVSQYADSLNELASLQQQQVESARQQEAARFTNLGAAANTLLSSEA